MVIQSNPLSRSYILAIHEYAHRNFKKDIKYYFDKCRTDGETCATVVIDGLIYTTQSHANKHTARNLAAKAAAEILLPECREAPGDTSPDPYNLKMYDELMIATDAIPEMQMLPKEVRPYSILKSCLQRNHACDDTSVKSFTTAPEDDSPASLIMNAGNHESVVPLTEFAEQAAAHEILMNIHPHLETWGSLIRMYLVNSAHDAERLAKSSSGEVEIRSAAPPITTDPSSAVAVAVRGPAPSQLRVLRPPDEHFITDRAIPQDHFEEEEEGSEEYEEQAYTGIDEQALAEMNAYTWNLFHGNYLGNGFDILGHYPADIEAGFTESEWEEI